jgi:hypothetical protein
MGSLPMRWDWLTYSLDRSHLPQGKAQPYDAKVLTPKGWTHFGKLCIGDEVVGSNGLPTLVTGVYPRGKRQTYRVEFDDGYGVEVSDDHLWSVRDEDDPSPQSLTFSTKHLLNLISGNPANRPLRWAIPVVQSVIYDCSSTVLPLDPYLLGLYLSCGCLDGEEIHLKLSGQNAKSIAAKLSSVLPCEVKDTFVRVNLPESSVSVIETLQQRDLIPECYLHSSIQSRVSLIQGIFDILGEVPVTGNSILCAGLSCTQTTASIVEVIQSLGGIASLEGTRLRATFPPHICPFADKDKELRYKNLTQEFKGPTRRIKSIVCCRFTDVLCISVKAEDHLYVTDHFIVTHNTIQVNDNHLLTSHSPLPLYQTISLLAYLATYRGLWGPHLIIVPTSCLINWEIEFKKWSAWSTLLSFSRRCHRCPAFKVLTYYGSQKARKALRNGWSKLNSFHVCITSYQVVVQDSSSFRRKRWYYMILDEAHNIKVSLFITS